MTTQQRPRERLNGPAREQILKAQKNEITEYHVYSALAGMTVKKSDKEALQNIASQEKNHAEIWKEYTQTTVQPDQIKILTSGLLARIFGFTFAAKLMEKGEQLAQINYSHIAKVVPEAAEIEKEENQHEQSPLGILDEDRLKYVSSMVLGLNDALVELTGVLAGLTLALQNTKLIAVTGLITGVAASLSMGASEYLSTRSEKAGKDPVKASLYTGVMYVVTVIILILPFFFVSSELLALLITMILAILIIFFFTFYISVAQDLSFKKRFLEMAGLSLGVAALTFGIGFVVRVFFDIHI